MQLQHQLPGKVPEGFRRVPVQIPVEFLKGSGADSWLGSGGFRCRYLVRFQRVSMQIAGEVAQGSHAIIPEGSRKFRCRYLLRFWRVSVQIPSDQIPGEVPEGSGAGTR